MSKINEKIGFIGAGKMAEAITGALINSEKVPVQNINLCDVNKDRLTYMSEKYGVNVSTDSSETFNKCSIIILAVKPQVMETVLNSITEDKSYKINDKKILITIAAGIRLKKYESILYKSLDKTAIDKLPIIRVMPNTPGLVLEGMAGICKNRHTSDSDIKLATEILESMGKVLEVDESLMDAVTAVSGSGPAYFFYFIEALSEAGVKAGLSEEDSLMLSKATIKGAARLLELSTDSPVTLKNNVTSPGGTTEAALKVMEEKNVKENIIKAVLRAAERSNELSG